MYEKEEKSSAVSNTVVAIFLFIWMVLGVAAFIMSLLCFGKSGTMPQQVFGFLLAIIFGPFYWIYYLVAKKYCR